MDQAQLRCATAPATTPTRGTTHARNAARQLSGVVDFHRKFETSAAGTPASPPIIVRGRCG